jgi:predicted PhzF superfamily epimerase YddE/YHI9
MAAATLHVLRVFCAEDNTGGNRLGVFLDGAEIAAERRQAVAADLGFAETVFVDDRANGGLRIFTPEIELPLAGHPLVGTAWLLRDQGDSVSALGRRRARSGFGSRASSPSSPPIPSGRRRSSSSRWAQRPRSTR